MELSLLSGRNISDFFKVKLLSAPKMDSLYRNNKSQKIASKLDAQFLKELYILIYNLIVINAIFISGGINVIVMQHSGLHAAFAQHVLSIFNIFFT